MSTATVTFPAQTIRLKDNTVVKVTHEPQVQAVPMDRRARLAAYTRQGARPLTPRQRRRLRHKDNAALVTA